VEACGICAAVAITKISVSFVAMSAAGSLKLEKILPMN
jgi:hypothetical protein